MSHYLRFSLCLFFGAIFACAAVFTSVFSSTVRAATVEEIAEKNRQIEEIQRQIEQYQTQIDANRSKAGTLQGEVTRLNALISQVTLEIRGLELSIGQTSDEIGDTQAGIDDALGKLEKHKSALAQYVRLAYEGEQKTLTEILLNNETLSDFFSDLNDIKGTQDNLRVAIGDIKNLKMALDEKKEDLESKKTDLEKLRGLQELEKRDLDGNKAQKDKILRDTRGEEARYQDLVKRSQEDINRIRAQITYLQQNGVSVEDAIKYGQLAAISAGIRPSFLLGVLEVESGLGRNVGKGNWIDDMYQCYLRLGKPSRAEQEKAAFLEIIGKLGLDPNTVKVSREPNYGCGGALGPAQFIPTTWLGYEADVARLTGHAVPNPWLVEDAFTAAAIKLAKGGATSKDVAGETRAARAYVGGSGSCTSKTCVSYSNAVLRKAAEIEKNL